MKTLLLAAALSVALVGCHPPKQVAIIQPHCPDDVRIEIQNNRVVNFAGPVTLVDRFVDVRIINRQPHSLRGELQE